MGATAADVCGSAPRHGRHPQPPARSRFLCLERSKVEFDQNTVTELRFRLRTTSVHFFFPHTLAIHLFLSLHITLFNSPSFPSHMQKGLTTIVESAHMIKWYTGTRRNSCGWWLGWRLRVEAGGQTLLLITEGDNGCHTLPPPTLFFPQSNPPGELLRWLWWRYPIIHLLPLKARRKSVQQVNSTPCNLSRFKQCVVDSDAAAWLTHPAVAQCFTAPCSCQNTNYSMC